MSAAPQELIDRPRPRIGIVTLAAVALSLGFGFALALWRPMPVSAADRHQLADAVDGTLSTQNCLRLAAKPPVYSEMAPDAYQRASDAWAASCREAMATDDDSRLKVSLAQALRAEQRTEQVALLRAAAAQDNAEACYLIYESHKSWDQHADRPQLISRAEADRTLRRSAELGNPDGTYMLAILLERGGIVKRDLAAARLWAERALDHLPTDTSRASALVRLGRLLAGSDRPEERRRGLDRLEQMSRSGQFGARSALADAIRRDDPVRARALLEEALRPDPGGSIPRLARMLSRGEGGPADQNRAIKLLTSRNDIGAISGARAEFILDGRLPPRDLAKAIDLLRHAGVWDFDARQRMLQLLIANPEVRLERPDGVLYDAMIAAELDEPGAMATLIDLKLSDHPQFRDRPGGCKLLETAAARGDQVAPERLADCRAS